LRDVEGEVDESSVSETFHFKVFEENVRLEQPDRLVNDVLSSSSSRGCISFLDLKKNKG